MASESDGVGGHMKRADAQRAGLKRADRIESESDRSVNEGHRPVTSVGNMQCPKPVDIKGFTGKGARAELRHLEAGVDSLEQHMAQLIAVSKEMKNVPMHLAMHRRTASGYVALRWRADGAAGKHLSWAEARDLYARYPAHLRRWYAELTDLAIADNAAHLELKRRMRELQTRIANTDSVLYPRFANAGSQT